MALCTGCLGGGEPTPQTVQPLGLRVAWPEPCGAGFCTQTLPSRGTTLAVGDLDHDGRPDLLLGESGPLLGNLGAVTVLRNLGGDRGFVDVTHTTGLAGYGVWSAMFVDIDNDGDEDLVAGGRRLDETITETGQVMVFTNDNHGHFSLAVEDLDGQREHGAPTALDVADFDRDGLLDVMVGRMSTTAERPPRSAVMFGRPGLRFERAHGVAEAPGSTWVTLATDLSHDGLTDMMFFRDGNTVFQAPADGCSMPDLQTHAPAWTNSAWVTAMAPQDFTLTRTSLGETFDSQYFTPMGVAVGDFNDDGRLDYVMTQTQGPALFESGGAPMPAECPTPTGLELPSGMRRGATSWSALARDLDRDGRDDVLVTYGEISERPKDESLGNVVYLGRGDGRFEPQADIPGFAQRDGSWSSMATADFDGDGDDDIVLGVQTLFRYPCAPRAPGALLLRNDLDTGSRHWLRIRLEGTVSNRDGLGARVEAPVGGRTIVREVSRAGATMGSSDVVVDLGLGDTQRLPWVQVRWPSGAVSIVREVSTNQLLRIVEPQWLTVTRDRDGSATVRVVSSELSSLTLSDNAHWVGDVSHDPSTQTFTRRFEGHGDTLVHAQTHGGLSAGRRVSL